MSGFEIMHIARPRGHFRGHVVGDVAPVLVGPVERFGRVASRQRAHQRRAVAETAGASGLCEALAPVTPSSPWSAPVSNTYTRGGDRG